MTVRADNPLQQYGYVRVYRYLVTEVGHTAAYVYGVLEWLAQLSENQERPLSPSLEWIADAAGTSKSSAQRCLATLRKEGWLDWKKVAQQGGVYNHYSLRNVQFDSEGYGQSDHRGKVKDGQSDHRKDGQSDHLVRIETELEDIPPVGATPPSPSATTDHTPSEQFSELWAGWPSGKKGPKMLAEATWAKLSPADRQMALEALPLWVESVKWQKGYVRECHRWLRYREFDGEVPGGVEPSSSNGRMAETHDLRRSMNYLAQQAGRSEEHAR